MIFLEKLKIRLEKSCLPRDVSDTYFTIFYPDDFITAERVVFARLARL